MDWKFYDIDRLQAQRSSEATLANSFATLQLKKFELEFSVDPLFKKASADFDEGGAKGLLLNHLMIDAHGRIVFDSSDDANDASAETELTKNDILEEQQGTTSEGAPESAEECPSNATHDIEIDLHALRSAFFPDLDKLDEQDICPSLKNFDLGDPAASLNIPFLKAQEDWQQEREDSEHEGPRQNAGLGDQTGIYVDEHNAAGFDDDDGALAGFDLAADAGFGEGGEAWARDAAIGPQLRIDDGNYGGNDANTTSDGVGVGVGDFDPDGNTYVVSLNHGKQERNHEDILSYFDGSLQKNWAGPEHWRIKRLKDTTKAQAPAPSRRKEKEPFEIDFLSPLDPAIAELIYTPATSNSAISLPKSQWKSKTRNLLPDDKHFNSRQLLHLFLKPKARIGSRRLWNSGNGRGGGTSKRDEIAEDGMDEAFWAKRDDLVNQVEADEEIQQGNYDANFFQDDGIQGPAGPLDDEDEFADAREAFSPDDNGDNLMGIQGLDKVANGTDGSQDGAFGTQLVTQSRRLRPEYVQYARVAKKVDVRRLKEEMWKGIGFREVCRICP